MNIPESLVVWLNGQWLAEQQAKISIFDNGFSAGDGVFDLARTFGGKPFQLTEHVNRLLESCQYLDLNPGLSRDKLIELGQEVAARNFPLVKQHGDYWVTFHVTRGVDRTGYPSKHTLLVYCDPIPFKQRAPLYRDGISTFISGIRRTPHWALSPRSKTHNYLNVILAELQARAIPGAWPILLDENGYLAEGASSNIFLVKAGVLYTPLAQGILPGISRQTVLQLARELKIPTEERNLDLQNLYLADEMFLTSTSLCICPISKVDGRILKTPVPGYLTGLLTKAYCDYAGFDFKGQYLSYL